MDLRHLVYGACCAVALLYLASANARGYLPFVTAAQHVGAGSGTHYHK